MDLKDIVAHGIRKRDRVWLEHEIDELRNAFFR